MPNPENSVLLHAASAAFPPKQANHSAAFAAFAAFTRFLQQMQRAAEGWFHGTSSPTSLRQRADGRPVLMNLDNAIEHQ